MESSELAIKAFLVAIHDIVWYLSGLFWLVFLILVPMVLLVCHRIGEIFRMLDARTGRMEKAEKEALKALWDINGNLRLGLFPPRASPPRPPSNPPAAPGSDEDVVVVQDTGRE